MLEQGLVGVDEIGARHLLVPARMFYERLFERQVADRVAALVVAQQAVEAARSAREDEFTDLDVGLNGARSAQPHQREPLFFGLLLPRGEIDVGQRVQLRDADVDVADADAGREDRHAFSFIAARHGLELAVRNLALLRVEKSGYEGHAAGVADQDHRVGQLPGMQVQVKNRTVVVDNQFGSGNGSHNCRFLISIIGIKVIYLPRISKLRSEFFINISIRKTE